MVPMTSLLDVASLASGPCPCSGKTRSDDSALNVSSREALADMICTSTRDY